jgi:hypothetical protein
MWAITLAGTLAMWIWTYIQKPTEQVVQAAQLMNTIQWTCSELISENSQVAHSREFWQKYVTATYPKNQKWSLVHLIAEVKSFEEDPVVGEFTQKISQHYLWSKPPKWVIVNEWVTEQLQQNLWDIIHSLVNYTWNNPDISSIASPMLESFKGQCMKNTI